MAESVLKRSDFGKLPDGCLSALSAVLERFDGNEGDILCKENEMQHSAYVIEDGEIGCYKKHPEKDEVVCLETKSSGGTVGFFHIFANDPAFFTLKVKSKNAIYWKITASAFKELLQTSDAFFCGWLNYVHREVRLQTKIIRSFKESKSDSSKTDRIRIAVYDSSAWTYCAFDQPDYQNEFEFIFFKERLDENTARFANGCDIVCAFVNDILNQSVLRILNSFGIQMISLRCAGFDKVDIDAAKVYNITVSRVPAYSPYAVAEHAITLLLALNRKIHRAYQRTRETNFDLRGLIGFDLHGKTAGVIGTGKIGRCLIDILIGFGCKVLCYDLYPSEELKQNPKVTYVELDELYSNSDFISLHAPATESTHHMINEDSINKMKKGCYIINTSRGSLVNTNALLNGLHSGKVGAAGLDVYEGESPYFFKDNSDSVIADKALQQLVTLPNVLVTGHQAFLTREAINNIAETTLNNIRIWKSGKSTNSHPNSIY